MACLRSIDRFVKRNSLPVNIAINILLVFLCVTSYAVLLTLYFTEGMNISSLVYISVKPYTVPPTVVIPLLGVTLTSATSALLTRSVEHSLWETILRDKPITSTGRSPEPEDAGQQAQWSTSSFARLRYAFGGRSWTLRFGGLFLLGTAVVNPVLLWGVRPYDNWQLEESYIVPTQPAFSGFTSEISAESPLPDASMTLASLASMNNLSVPLADVVCDPQNCDLNADIPALLAECVTSSQPWSSESPTLEVRCSAFGNETCIAWTPDTVLNFTTGPFSTCSKRTAEDLLVNGESLCPPGDFAVIFGEWLSSNAPEEEEGWNLTASTKHTVDCRVSYGTVSIKQQHFGPQLNRMSFVKSSTPIGEQGFLASLWQYGFLGHGDLNYSPYTFACTHSDLNAMTPLSRYLVPLAISPDDVNATAKVGQMIEANFDTTTLFAFARAPHAANVHVESYPSEDVWGYDPRVLFVLVLPFLAKVLVLSSHRGVQSGEVVIGYDPVLIARRADEVLGSSYVVGRRCGGGSSGESLGLDKGKVGRTRSRA